MLDKTPADSGSRERAQELQLDEVMVFVAKLTFLGVCGICSVTTVAMVISNQREETHSNSGYLHYESHKPPKMLLVLPQIP